MTRVGATLITDDVGLSTFLTFDLLGRKTSQNDPDMGYWTWTYDANGNVLSQTDAKNQTLTYAYDRLNRRIATNYPNGTATLFYYDGDDNRDGTIDPGRSGMKGRLTAIKAPDATEILTYDALGRLTRKDVTIAPENTTKSESFAYDAMDRVVGVAYPDNEVVTNSFNTGGRLETVSGKIGSTTTNYVTGIDYDPLGGVTRMALGNGQTINYDYYDTPSEIDPGTGLTMSFRLKKVSTTDTSLLNLTYTYDRRGNVLSKTDGAVSANSETYWYDDFNRVVLSASASAGVRTYFYDSSGNITMKDNIAYLYGDESHAHAVTSKGSSGYSYDANGNMVNRNGASLTYDYENRLVESGAFPAQRYAYLGERRVRAANNMDQSSDVTWYPFGNYEEQGHETGGSHTPTQVASRKYYYANGVRVAQRTAASGVQYILSDRLGSAAVVTSANGTLVGRQAYAPFGTQLGADSIPTAYTFTGKERDGANGLYYYGARFYDSDLGRFVTPDTMIPTGTPQTRNRYAYADNNPVRYTDPSGHAVIPTILNLALSGPNLWGFRPNDVIHVGVGVMADALGVKSISFGFYAGVGGEVSYNFRDNTMSGAFGVGGGAHANISTTRMDYGGACGSWVAIGYDQQGNTVFLTAQAQAQFGPVGVGAGGRLGYSFDSGEAEFSANAGGGVFGASVGASYSSRGGVTFSAGVGVPGLEGAGVGVQYNAKNGGWRGSVSLSMCFVKGTLVDTKSGGKPIEQIQAGDEVLAMDESTGTMGYKKVVRTFVNHTHAIAKVKVGGVEIESTPGHRFWVVGDDGGRWITAESLQPGMQLVSFAGTPVSVDAVSVEKRSEEVYNFEVEEWHTYVAGGVVVHNECTDKDKDENGELVGPLACFETAGTSQPAPKSSWDAGAFALYGVETESLGTFGEAALIVDFDGSTELISGGGKEVGVPYVGNAKAGALVTPHGTTIYTFELHAGAWSVGSFSEQSGNHMQAGYYVTGGNMAFAGYGAYLGFPWPF